MKKLFFILPFVIIATSVYLVLTNSWITPGINKWQAGIMGDNKYFPVLTIFIMALPPLLLLALVKFISDRSANKK